MTKKLLSIIALGTALAVITAGSATSLTPEAPEVRVDVPAPADLPECSDLTDNDLDGLADLEDPDCAGALDDSEAPEPAPPAGEPAPAPAAPPAPAKAPKAKAPKAEGPAAKGGLDQPARQAPGKGLFGTKLPSGGKGAVAAERAKLTAPGPRAADGTPTGADPSLTIAPFGPAPIGVPNFVIDRFEIPPFLLPIYQSCGTEYGIPWQVLASINRIETAFGTNLNVSSAGAMGWMQFIPSSWKAYGVDANEDGRRDPYNPLDAICAAARYLKAADWASDPRAAIFAYNHADWYVDEVLLYANQYARLPDDLVGSLTGLTEGAHFPVAADARYADDISERAALKRSTSPRQLPGNAADVIADAPTRRGIDIYSRAGAPVVAVNDGQITALGRNRRLGRYIVLADAYGNRYTYAELGEIAATHPVARERALGAADFELQGPNGAKGASDDAAPAAPASEDGAGEGPGAEPRGHGESGPLNTEALRERLFALPERAANAERAGVAGQLSGLLGERLPGYESFRSYFSSAFRFNPATMELAPLKVGSRVAGGTVLGRIGADTQSSGAAQAPHLHFSIRPAGRGAPRIDPKPILDGWKLLESTAIYRAAGEDPFGATEATVGQILLMSKASLIRRVLADPRLEIYACGRTDISSGQIDRRTLAALAYLTERGYRLAITSLRCGHSFYTSSGNVSAHSSGNAVDIAQVNGLPILGNQGRGSLTEAVVRDLMELQGPMLPSQIITLMDLGGPSFAMADHADHIHVGYTPSSLAGPGLAQVLKPEQWGRLIERLGEIENPEVDPGPSRAALPAQAPERGADASHAHRGE